MRPDLLALVLLLAAGCIRPQAQDALQGASVAGELDVADGWQVEHPRLDVAPRDAPAAAGQTRLARDHWLLVVDVVHVAKEAIAPEQASLSWNGEEMGAIPLAGNATVRWDVGARLETSDVYVIRIASPIG
jgi:hypothetical protein